MAPPPYTAAQVRAGSEYLKEKFPAADPYDPNADALSPFVSIAAELVSSLTCRAIADGADGDEVPAAKEDLALYAVTLKAEQVVGARGTAKARRSSLGSGRLRSISAGPWSESYFGPGDAAAAKALDLDPALAEALWALATDDCRAAWIALWTGKQRPGAGVQSFPWGNAPGRYRAPLPPR